MKLIGFSISEDVIALVRGGDRFDLHNDFDFQGLSYSATERLLELHWHRGAGEWVKQTDPPDLRLSFSGVDLFKVQERDPEMPFAEDGCLDSIGFIWDDMVAEMGGFTSNQPGEDCTHLIASFMGGFSIKVGAESVALHAPGVSVAPVGKIRGIRRYVMKVFRALLVVLVATVAGCASDATIRSSEDALAGRYYSGDGLGRMVYVDLHPDGTFRSDWQGCLGLYGEAAGTWQLQAEKIMFTPDSEAGSLAGFLREAITIKHSGKLGFARDQDVESERIQERLIFTRQPDRQ